MRLLAQRHSLLLQATALAPLIALVAPVDRAEAACTPASSASDTTVTCTGTNQKGPAPTPATARMATMTIPTISRPARRWRGTRSALFSVGHRLNNSGTIIGSVAGVRAHITSCTTLALLHGGRRPNNASTGTVGILGTIAGLIAGLDVQNGEVVNLSTGTYRRTNRSATSPRNQSVQSRDNFGRRGIVIRHP